MADLATFEVADVGFGKGVVAARDLPPGTTVYSVPCSSGTILAAPTMYTIQLTATEHIDITGGPEFTNHSCEPNGYFKFVTATASNDGDGDGDGNGSGKITALDLVLTRFVAKGELVTFNYNTTEWDMDAPFECCCGTRSCYRVIRGFKHLTQREREAIRPIVSSHLLQCAVAADATPSAAGTASSAAQPSSEKKAERRFSIETDTTDRNH